MDGFINDIVTLAINGTTWVERSKNAVLLVIHTIFRILQPTEQIDWDDSNYKGKGTS